MAWLTKNLSLLAIPAIYENFILELWSGSRLGSRNQNPLPSLKRRAPRKALVAQPASIGTQALPQRRIVAQVQDRLGQSRSVPLLYRKPGFAFG